jgi:hypothetical protein
MSANSEPWSHEKQNAITLEPMGYLLQRFKNISGHLGDNTPFHANLETQVKRKALSEDNMRSSHE